MGVFRVEKIKIELMRLPEVQPSFGWTSGNDVLCVSSPLMGEGKDEGESSACQYFCRINQNIDNRNERRCFHEH